MSRLHVAHLHDKKKGGVRLNVIGLFDGMMTMMNLAYMECAEAFARCSVGERLKRP